MTGAGGCRRVSAGAKYDLGVEKCPAALDASPTDRVQYGDMFRLAWMLILVSLLHMSLRAGEPGLPTPQISARAGILTDRYTGMVLWEQNADQPLPMASTTKIMTAMVIMDHGADRLLEKVTVSEKAASTGGSSVYAAGDVVPLGDLLRAALLRSSNEATVAAAEFLGGKGGEAQFVQWMNDKARDLGLKHTHFVTPHGLYVPDHYSSARDLAIMARQAMTYPLIRQLVSTKLSYTYVPQRNVKVSLDNHNKALGRPLPGVPGAVIDGVKTGYVKEAGKCLVSSASVKGWQLLAVVLNSPDMYQETECLLAYGFTHYAWHTYATETQTGLTAPVEWGDKPFVPLGARGVLGAPVLRREFGGQDDDKVVLHRASLVPLPAPVAQGTEIGTLDLIHNGQVVISLPAYTLHAVPQVWWLRTARKTGYSVMVLLVLAIVGKIYGTRAKIARRRRSRFQASRRRADSGGPGEREWRGNLAVGDSRRPRA